MSQWSDWVGHGQHQFYIVFCPMPTTQLLNMSREFIMVEDQSMLRISCVK